MRKRNYLQEKFLYFAQKEAQFRKYLLILKQRQEYVEKIDKILTNLGHEMDLPEDPFGLISDQIRARPPAPAPADIEGVVYQTDSMTKLLEELAPTTVGRDGS